MKQLMNRRVMIAALAALAATTWSYASAAEADKETFFDPERDIVITGTRVAQPLQTVPVNMSVVTGKDLQDRHVTNMEEALRLVPGLYQQAYAPVGYESTNALRINGSNNVQYLVDGISMTMPNIGYFTPVQTFQNMDSIDRVEVLKGAASSLYGSNAVGGVINVITRKPEEGMKTKLRVMGGSYNQEQYGLSNEGRQGNVYWRASYVKDHMGTFKDGHGNRIPQASQSRTASFMVGSEIDKNNDIRLAYDSYRANVKYADSMNALGHIRHGHRKYDGFRAIWNNTINENWKHSLHVGRNEYATRDEDALYGPSSLKVRSLQVGDQVTYQKGQHTVVGGFDWEQYKAVSVNNEKITNTAFYVQDAYKVAPKWTITPGLRVDHHSTFGTHTSPHMSVGYDINDKTNVYVAYNRFFVAPSAYQLFDSYYGNRDLDPEQGYEWTMGVHHKWNDSLSGNASVFVRKTTDKIVYASHPTAANPFAGYYDNVEEEKAYGFSADVAKRIGSDWTTRLAYTYTNVKANGQYAGANINGFVPKHEILAGVDYKHHKWDAHFDARIAMQRRGPVSANGPAFPRNSYVVANLSANYQATDNIKVFGAINNVFDTYYAENTNVAYGGAGDWWSMPGRNYRVGLELSF